MPNSNINVIDANTVQESNRNLLDDLKWCMSANLCGYLTRSDAEFINKICGQAYEEIKTLRGKL